MIDMLTIKLDDTWCPEGYNDIHVRLLVADVSTLMTDEVLLDKAVGMLSPQRRAKAEACGNPRVRALSAGAALAVDRLLSEQDLREQEMEYVEGNHGKPSFAGIHAHLVFNLSHSGRMVAAVLCQPQGTDIQLGVDIQHITRYRPELVRRMFCTEDRSLLATCQNDEARQRLFTRLWTRAEAYAKATGNGLQFPFATPSPAAIFHDFLVDEDYCGCICLMPPS